MNILRDKSFRLSIIISLIFLSIGFLLLHYGLIAYGWAFFILLPIAVGIGIGALPDKKWAIYGSLVGGTIFILLLFAGQAEGFICVLMSLPIIIPFVFLGYIISHLIKRYRLLKQTDNLKIILFPFIIFLIIAPIEKNIVRDSKSIIEVRTEIILPFLPMQVYNAIKSVDTLNAEKPWLMKLDLPVPEKCVLEKEEVGGLRTCYFTGGKIVEQITQLKKGEILKMNVIDYKLTGRKWLGFKEAIYLFEPIKNNETKLTRITTYTSELHPRFYWRPLEELGIQQEHEYVFSNLKKDLNKKYR
ncbi:MAG TPA: hypothetical protein VMY77_01150 [Chitinophagaceae bacterium]|nr:hypothetical protein [Chitinophagaceae bacterium]